MIIGLTGTKASGKGEVADFLKQRGFVYLSLSDMVRQEAANRGLRGYTVKDLQNIGNELREKFGNSILAKRALDIIKKEAGNYVVDGIRNTGEVKELRSLTDFVLIAVDAPESERFERLKKRARPSDPKTYPEFLEMDKRDRGSHEKGNGQQVDACIQMANYQIHNDSALDKLYGAVENILAKHKDKIK
jgi:dephospho-CoA kinase